MLFFTIYSIVLTLIVLLLTRLRYIKIINKLTLINKRTGIYKREYFDKIYISEFHRARRINHPISLIFIKSDPSSIVTNELLHSIKRDTDFIAHYNEELYIAVLYDTDSEGADQVIDRIMSNRPEGHSINMGVYAGVPDNHISSSFMIDETLNALKKSIEKGANAVEFSLNSV